MFFMICDKSIKQPERRIQYSLTDKEFVDLRVACVKHNTNLKSFTREAVIFYLEKLKSTAETCGVE